MPNTWSVSASAEFLDDDALACTRPGQKCLIYIGGDMVITSWIDRRAIPIDAPTRQVVISGRGITRNLVDCTADLVNDPALNSGMINGANTFGVAQTLCKTHGITARSAVADLGARSRNSRSCPARHPKRHSAAGDGPVEPYHDDWATADRFF